jgi:hypothetical protein
MARQSLLIDFRDDAYWPEAVISLRTGLEGAAMDAHTIFSLGKAGDEKSRRVVEHAILDESIVRHLRFILAQRLFKPRRYASWRKRFYFELSDRLGRQICPLDPYHNPSHRVDSRPKFTLTTGIANGISIKLVTEDWEEGVSVYLFTSNGDELLGFFPISDISGSKLATDVAADAIRRFS